MKDVGRPSQLDDEQFLLKIRDLVIESKTEAEMQKILDIPKGTWDYWKWKNYNGFQDKLINYRLERMLDKGINNLEVLQDSEDERVNLQANSLVVESVGKKWFSKRTEMTGADGKELIPDKQSTEKAEQAIQSYLNGS